MQLCSGITPGRLRKPHGVPGIKLKSAMCKASGLPAEKLLQDSNTTCEQLLKYIIYGLKPNLLQIMLTMHYLFSSHF